MMDIVITARVEGRIIEKVYPGYTKKQAKTDFELLYPQACLRVQIGNRVKRLNKVDTMESVFVAV